MNNLARVRAALVAVVFVLTATLWAQAPQLPNPGHPSMSKQQQEQLGLQAMAQVYQQMPVLPDSNPVTKYVQQLGAKLVKVIPPNVSWPYQFHVVQQKDINAFALPGGPIFINAGTIQAADNEAQLVGVMAHEMSHVYMQHTAKSAVKDEWAQGIASVLGAVLGNGTLGNLARAGIQIGGGMVMMKYSRADEAQADATGAIIMYKAGYDPHAMAQFFKKLESQGGAPPQFLSDHPNPGNRVQAVDNEVRNWPPKQYTANSQAFMTAKQQVNGIKMYTAQEIDAGAKNGTWAQQNRKNGATPSNLPAPPPGAAQNGNAPANGNGGNIANVTYQQVQPSGNMNQLQGQGFTISYPQNWQAQADQNGGGTIAPPAGIANGNIAYGVTIGAGQVQNASSLDQATQQIVQGIEQGNQGLQATGSSKTISVGGTQGESIELSGTSPVQQNGQALPERDWLVTMPIGQNAVRYFVFTAPERDFTKLQPTFERMLESVRTQ
jgi:hypothetical protein